MSQPVMPGFVEATNTKTGTREYIPPQWLDLFPTTFTAVTPPEPAQVPAAPASTKEK